jgi:serine/threonine protein kinase
MGSLAQAIHQLQDGALQRTEFFAQIDRVLESAPESGGRLLEVLSEEHARKPLQVDVYTEVQRRIERMIAARQRMGGDDTFVQTKPSAFTPSGPLSRPPPAPVDNSGSELERMKGVGDTLNGRFVLEECIGFGGMGTVYKALDLRKLEASDRKPYIAIKVLNVQFRGHPKSLIALQREARKAQALAHPNIVSVYDFDRDGAMVYLTMELLSGKPLSQVLRAPGFSGMPYADVVRIVIGMGNALAYAHGRGFVHCDFKPGNVFLMDSGDVKVIDFGIARVFQKSEQDVDVTVFDPGSLGALTPAYASPEMLEQRDPDPRDDIYALACITYELLTGRHPFNRMSALQARGAGVKPQRPPNLGRTEWQALKCGLALEREERTPTVQRFLSEFGGGSSVSRYAPAMATAAGIVAAGVLALVAWRFIGQESTPDSPAAAPAASAQAGSEATPAAPAQAPAPVRAQESAPASVPVPVPTAAAIAAVLAQVPCSALAPAIRGHAVEVQGFLPKSVGPARLKEMLGAVPGVSEVNLSVQQVDPDKCAVISTFAPYWVAHRRAGDGVAIRLAGTAADARAVLTEGDSLMVDITTANAESFVSVDYFALDSSVVHLLPNPRARENRAPARHNATVGSMGEWGIGKPFGNELVVLLTTPVPLFDTLRPVSESGTAYLKDVAARLEQIRARNGGDKIAVDFLQISTQARKR